MPNEKWTPRSAGYRYSEERWRDNAQLSDCAYWWNDQWGFRPYIDIDCLTKLWKRSDSPIEGMLPNPYNRKWQIPKYLGWAFENFFTLPGARIVDERSPSEVYSVAVRNNKALNDAMNGFMECFYWPLTQLITGEFRDYRQWYRGLWNTPSDPIYQLHLKLVARYGKHISIEDVRAMLLRWAICQATWELGAKYGDVLDSSERGVDSEVRGNKFGKLGGVGQGLVRGKIEGLGSMKGVEGGRTWNVAGALLHDVYWNVRSRKKKMDSGRMMWGMPFVMPDVFEHSFGNGVGSALNDCFGLWNESWGAYPLFPSSVLKRKGIGEEYDVPNPYFEWDVMPATWMIDLHSSKPNYWTKLQSGDTSLVKKSGKSREEVGELLMKIYFCQRAAYWKMIIERVGSVGNYEQQEK